MAETERPACPLWAKIIATGGGVGYIPFAPGTWGSLAAIGILFIVRWLSIYPVIVYFPQLERFREPFFFLLEQAVLILTLFYSIAGIPAATRFAKHLRQKDPGRVVIDEFAGQTLAFTVVSMVTDVNQRGSSPCSLIGIGSMESWLLLFILFRLFDILKPWPIRRIEKLPWGWGIMLDDLAAGLMAGLSFLIIHWCFPILTDVGCSM